MKKRLPKIVKINRVDPEKLLVSVLFSTGEHRLLNFKHIFEHVWKVAKADPEHKLKQPREFAKVVLSGYTLSWPRVVPVSKNAESASKELPFEVGADTLYNLSTPDHDRSISIGAMLKRARLSAKLSQAQVAERAGTSRTYITKLENDGADVELLTLKKIVEAGLNKHLSISIK